MSDKPKEDVYDNQISPLMTQIIAICKEHKIAMLADFALDEDEDSEDGPLKCTTTLLTDDHDPTDEQIEAMRILLRPAPSFLAVTITTSKATP